MKKVLFAALLLLLCLFSLSAWAYEGKFEARLLQYGCFPEDGNVSVMKLDEGQKNAYDKMKYAFENLAEWVDLYACHITEDELAEIFTKVINETPEFFYIGYEVGYEYDDDGIVTKMTIPYNCERSEIPERRREVEAEAEKVVALVAGEMSDFEKALLVHEYLTLNYEYDYSYTIADIYTFFKEKTGVCQAYALACTYIMKKLGIESETVVSNAMNHAWNIVNIDEQWYHIDVTWDDSDDNADGDILGYSAHKYFLCSDAALEGHYDWEAPYSAESTLYDDAYYTEYTAPFIYLNGTWYVKRYFSIYSIDIFDGTLTAVYEPEITGADAKWLMYGDNFNVATYEDYILFNTPNEIYALNPNGNELTQIYTNTTDGKVIVGIAAFDGTLRYRTSNERYADDSLYGSIDLNEFFNPESGFSEITSLDVGEGILSVELRLGSAGEGARLYAAGYDDEGALIFLRELDIENPCAEIVSSAVYKVFLWSEISPLCKSAVLDTRIYSEQACAYNEF